MSIRPRAEELLRRLTADSDTTFREDQHEAIEQLVVDRSRVLVVQRTGWGKSAVYFIATRLLRDEGAGATVLISPLLALMRNQIEMARRVGVRAATINSSNRDDWTDIEEEVRTGAVDLLLISPERLNNVRFRSDVLPDVLATTGLLVVDEAHCISDWGHDFRPDYRRIGRILGRLPRGVPVLCTTATANDRVIGDIVEQLGQRLAVLRGTLDRESLELGAVDLPQQAQRMAWLAVTIPDLHGCGIVYCLTVADTRRVAGWLRSRGIAAMAYSGDTDHAERLATEEALLANTVKVVVATSALGMGFDKPDLTFVIHYQSPGSPVAYYQQVGRAGRAVQRAAGIVLSGHEDAEIQDYFIKTAFPPKAQAEQVVAFLEQVAAPVTLGEIEAEVNARHGRIESMLKVLEVEGAVERSGSRWQRTLAAWSFDEERVRRVTALRRAEQAAMADYATTTECRMAFLRRALDDPTVGPCGRCDNCTGRQLRVELEPAEVAKALAYLRRSELVVEPRVRWPSGIVRPSGAIPAESRLEQGRALSVYGDGGWGNIVRSGKYHSHRYSDELVEAAVALVRKWRPDPAPEWLTYVPSTSSPGLVADFGARLAQALNLPLIEAVQRLRAGRPQKEMANSAQQLRNVDGVFAVAVPVAATPCLLIDDIVDSRWTLTVVGVALREAGSGPVHPFVLAKAFSS